MLLLILGQGLRRKERESCSRGEDSGCHKWRTVTISSIEERKQGIETCTRELGGRQRGHGPLCNFTQEQPCLFVRVCQECISCLTLYLASVLLVQVCHSHCKLESRDGRTRYNQKVNTGIPCTCMVSSNPRDTILLALWCNHRIVCFMVWISEFSNIITPTPRTRRNNLDWSKDF